MPYYSTDSEEHLINIGVVEDPFDMWEDDGYIYSCPEDDGIEDELDPEVEDHNDEIMAELLYQDYTTDMLNNEDWIV